MFNIYGKWKLYAVLIVDDRGSRVYLVGSGEDLLKSRRNKSNWLVNNGTVLVCYTEEQHIKKFIDSGLTTETPMVISGMSLEPIDKELNAGGKTLFEFTVANSFVQSDNGEFESQYCMCGGCNHPVSAIVRSYVDQGTIDQINLGNTVHLEEGEVNYQCNNCHNEVSKTYRGIKVWKTITSDLLKLPEPPTSKRTTLKANFHDIPLEANIPDEAEIEDFLRRVINR